MKSLVLISWTACIASQEMEDRDGAAMLQMKMHRAKPNLQRQNAVENCVEKDIWYWLGGHKTTPMMENGDFKKKADGSYLEWKVMSSHNFSLDAQVVSYATTAKSTCSEWCQQTHQLPCVRGMDDAHHQSDNLNAESSTRCSVWPGGHNRPGQSIANAGCEQRWHTQLCACDSNPMILMTPSVPSFEVNPGTFCPTSASAASAGTASAGAYGLLQKQAPGESAPGAYQQPVESAPGQYQQPVESAPGQYQQPVTYDTQPPVIYDTQPPATPAPTDAPATPAPTDAPATPAPTDAPATPAPTDAPAAPAPTDAPAAAAPADAAGFEPALAGFREEEFLELYCLPDSEDGMAEHVHLEMVQESITSYEPNNPDRNGRKGPFRQINIKSGTNTTFNFLASVPYHRLIGSSFTFKMFDIDMGNKNGRAKESFILCGDHAHNAEVMHCGDDVVCQDETSGANCAEICNGQTQCKVMTATKAGYGCDNVLGDAALAPGQEELLTGIGDKTFQQHCNAWYKRHKDDAIGGVDGHVFAAQTMAEVGDVNHPVQQARSVEIKFTGVTQFELTFATAQGGGGRNFLYQLIAPRRQLCEPDVTVMPLITTQQQAQAAHQTPCFFSATGGGEEESDDPDEMTTGAYSGDASQENQLTISGSYSGDASQENGQLPAQDSPVMGSPADTGAYSR